jgi:hypothetical protein
MRPVSRGAVFWGAALITAGVVVLALQQGLLTENLVGQAVDWWPLILIGAGVAIIFAGALGAIATALAGVLVGVLIGGLIGGAASFPASCGTGDPQPLRPFVDGSMEGGGVVEIDLNCGTLEVAGGSGQAWSVEADEETADLLEVGGGPDELVIRVDEAMVLGTSHRLHVGVTVPEVGGTNFDTSLNASDATFDLRGGRWGTLTLDGNAVSIDVDLSDAEAEGLTAELNAGSFSLTVDQASRPGPIDLSANAGSFDVCAADDIGLAITVSENVATGHNLEEAGLTAEGDVWRTPDYGAAETQIEIMFSGNAASFTLNPEGGCS